MSEFFYDKAMLQPHYFTFTRISINAKAALYCQTACFSECILCPKQYVQRCQGGTKPHRMLIGKSSTP